MGSIVALRPVPHGLQAWSQAARRMAIVALDSGPWCYAWIIGHSSDSGARVRFVRRDAGETYPTFTTTESGLGPVANEGPPA